MDRKLLDLLCSPDTRQPLSLLEPRGLEALNRAIAGGQVLRAEARGPLADPDALGRRVAARLLEQGAGAFLA